jgi:hypothetical protein
MTRNAIHAAKTAATIARNTGAKKGALVEFNDRVGTVLRVRVLPTSTHGHNARHLMGEAACTWIAYCEDEAGTFYAPVVDAIFV